MKISDSTRVIEVEPNAVHCFDEGETELVTEPSDGCPNSYDHAFQEAVISETPLIGDEAEDRDHYDHGLKRYVYMLG